MPRRREPEPIEEQEREDAARRADQARSDQEYDALLAELRASPVIEFVVEFGAEAIPAEWGPAHGRPLIRREVSGLTGLRKKRRPHDD